MALGVSKAPPSRVPSHVVQIEERGTGLAHVVDGEPGVRRKLDQRLERLDVGGRAAERLPAEEPVIGHDEVGREERGERVPVARGEGAR